MFRVMLCMGALICGIAWGGALYPFKHDADAKRFYQLLVQYRCLVCQNQTLLDSDADFAQDMKSRMYVQVQQGVSNEMIQADLLRHYGSAIAMVPPQSGRHWVLWTAPIWLLLILSLVLYRRTPK